MNLLPEASVDRLNLPTHRTSDSWIPGRLILGLKEVLNFFIKII